MKRLTTIFFLMLGRTASAFFSPGQGWVEFTPVDAVDIAPSNQIVGFPSSPWHFDPLSRQWSAGRDKTAPPSGRKPLYLLDRRYSSGPSVISYGEEEMFVSGGPGGQGALYKSTRKDCYIAKLSEFKTQNGFFIEPPAAARKALPPMREGRRDHALIALPGGGVMACGGYTGTRVGIPLGPHAGIPLAGARPDTSCEMWEP